MNQLPLQQIQDLISDDRVPEAVALLRQMLENTPFLNEVLQQSARYNEISKQIRLGFLDFKGAAPVTAQIRAGLLDLVAELKKQSEKTGTEPDSADSFSDITTLERRGFEQQLQLATQKLQRLETAHLLATDEAQKFAYEYEIDKLKALCAELKAKLNP